MNTIHSLTGRGKQPASNDFHTSQSVHYPSTSEAPRAPAARRAASTGHMFPVASSSSSPHRAIGVNDSGRTSPEAPSWQPGMPLPGPPPGPPPPGARSQSLNRYPAGSSRSNSVNSDHGTPTPPPQRRLPRSLPRLVQYHPLRPTGMKTTTFRLPSTQWSRNTAVTSLRTSLCVSTRALTATHRQPLDLRVEMPAQMVCGNVDRKVVLPEMAPAAAVSCHPSVTTPGQAILFLLPRKAPSVNVERICARSQDMPVYLPSL